MPLAFEVPHPAAFCAARLFPAAGRNVPPPAPRRQPPGFRAARMRAALPRGSCAGEAKRRYFRTRVQKHPGSPASGGVPGRRPALFRAPPRRQARGAGASANVAGSRGRRHPRRGRRRRFPRRGRRRRFRAAEGGGGFPRRGRRRRVPAPRKAAEGSRAAEGGGGFPRRGRRRRVPAPRKAAGGFPRRGRRRRVPAPRRSRAPPRAAAAPFPGREAKHAAGIQGAASCRVLRRAPFPGCGAKRAAPRLLRGEGRREPARGAGCGGETCRPPPAAAAARLQAARMRAALPRGSCAGEAKKRHFRTRVQKHPGSPARIRQGS